MMRLEAASRFSARRCTQSATVLISPTVIATAPRIFAYCSTRVINGELLAVDPRDERGPLAEGCVSAAGGGTAPAGTGPGPVGGSTGAGGTVGGGVGSGVTVSVQPPSVMPQREVDRQ